MQCHYYSASSVQHAMLGRNDKCLQVKLSVSCVILLSFLLSFSVQGSVFSRIDALLGDLEWALVESTAVTHSSANWWDLLLPLA